MRLGEYLTVKEAGAVLVLVLSNAGTNQGVN